MLKKIEEVSQLSGVSKRTLQYYDNEGILPAKRSKNNYRLYDEEAMKRLWEILWYKEMGFELNEIKTLLNGNNMERVIEDKVRGIDKRIEELERQRNMIMYIKEYHMPVMKEYNKTYKEQIKMLREGMNYED